MYNTHSKHRLTASAYIICIQKLL